MRTLIAALLLAATGSSFAAGGHPWYFGLRVGDDLDKRLPAGPGALDTENVFGGYGGYHFNDWFGVEVSVSDLGRSERSGVLDAGFSLEGNLYTAGGTVRTALGDDRFSVFGGLGGFRVEEDGRAITIAGSPRLDNSESGFYVEAGGTWQATELVGLRLSYQWFDFDRDSDGTPWLGAQVAF